MVNRKLRYYHKEQPVIINIRYVERIYGTLVDFTDDTISIVYDGHNKAVHEHTYEEVTLSTLSIKYTAPDKYEGTEGYQKEAEVNKERLELRLDIMFGRGKPNSRTPAKQSEKPVRRRRRKSRKDNGGQG